MDRYFIDEIIEARLLSERKDNHLTEEEIDSRRKELLLEMAYDRQEFGQYLRYNFNTMAAHYMLVKYAKNNEGFEYLIGHWADEICEHIIDVQEMETKPKANNRKMVEKALNEEWFGKMNLLDKPDSIVRKTKAKIRQENIDMSEDVALTYATNFINEMPKIISLMAYGNSQDAEEYSKSLYIENYV